MKRLPGLLFMLLAFSSSGLAQGVRMSADFLPLDVGNRWVYDVTNEAGEKSGQIEFSVENYTIVSGTSFYEVSGFPFTTEAGNRIRLLRYDRQERQFIRVLGEDEGPLFLDDASTTEVLQTDPAGVPMKFVLKTDEMALTFERGVGIIEARLETDGGVRIAKIATLEGKSFARAGTSQPVAVSPAGPSLSDPSIPIAPLPPPVRTIETITPVTESNPRLDVYFMESPEGLKLVFEVENIAEKLLPFKFASGQSYDFVIEDAVTNREVWRWSKEQFFTQVVRSEAIRGKSKWTFEAVWRRRDNEGNPLPPGSYRLTAILTSQPPLQSGSVALPLR